MAVFLFEFEQESLNESPYEKVGKCLIGEVRVDELCASMKVPTKK